LINDGLVRDVARGVQSARKDLDLSVSDRIRLIVDTDSRRAIDAIEERKEWLAEQVLAVEVVVRDVDKPLSNPGFKSQQEPLVGSVSLNESDFYVIAGTGVDARVDFRITEVVRS
jgi:hypothetical protein